MSRPFSEPFDHEDTIFDRAEANERAARRADALARNEAVAKQEAEEEAVRRESARQFSEQTNDRARAAEYRAYGVTPPIINGVPTKTSLSLLLSFGWTIEEVFGQRMLIAPPPADATPRKRREDYDQSS